MTCDACDKAQTTILMHAEEGGVYPYRIGNKEIGYSSILIVACREHAKLAIDRLNGDEPLEE